MLEFKSILSTEVDLANKYRVVVDIGYKEYPMLKFDSVVDEQTIQDATAVYILNLKDSIKQQILNIDLQIIALQGKKAQLEQVL